LLRSWDGNTQVDSTAAAIFEAWYRRLPVALAGDELNPQLIRDYQSSFTFTSRFMLDTLKHPTSPWCDVVTTAEQESCADTARRSLLDALGDLRERLGADMNTWHWGGVHRVIFSHQPLGDVVVLDRLFSRSLPNGGDVSTVNVGTVGFRQPFEQHVAAGYRQNIDLASVDNGQFIQATGQSGHFLSPDYDAYLADWQAVRYRKMRFVRAAVDQDRAALLRLQPARSSE
jgi:penicillin amidase